ncbi:MAG: chemotaxis protein CheW [Coleofasciculaceae cyanobacterium]
MINSCWNQIGVWGDNSCPKLTTYIHCHNCPIYSTAGRQLLDREVPIDYLNDQTKLLAQTKDQQRLDTISLGIFRLEKEWFALPIQLFKEVTEPSIIHTLPHRSNKTFLGLISIKGEINICISLHEFLGIERSTSISNFSSIVYKRMLVIEKEGNQWVFGVDEIYGVHRVTVESLQNVPTTISKAIGTYTKSVIKWQEKSITYLDEDLLFYAISKKVL